MKIENVNIAMNKVEKIYHISDIHIRNTKRHGEYNNVFDKVFEEIEKDKQNAIAIVTGDIVHAKLDMSPELVNMMFDFFKKLSDIIPTIIISGNHDCNLNNSSRMDVITPIIKNINSENLYYFKDSGVYYVNDIPITVMSVFDDPSDYIKSNNIHIKGDTKIALYHGTVDDVISDTGFKIRNSKVNLKLFDGYDLVLLGDIHKPQILQTYNKIEKKPLVAFAGSLIQQHYGEMEEHGIMKWDVINRKVKFIEIENSYSFITIDIENGIFPKLSELKDNSRLRLRLKNTDQVELVEIVSKIKEQYPNLTEVIQVKIPDTVDVTTDNINKIDVGDVRDISFQNESITKFLGDKYVLEQQVYDKIYEINSKLNLAIKPRDYQRNVIWKPKSFEFSNMFSYGTGNKINFSKLKGIVGLFANNRSGKSNLIESLSFSIFDKSPRALKGDSAMNNKKNSFHSKFIFNIGDSEFTIKRDASRNKSGAVSVKSDFSVVDNDGSAESLNGDRRSSTNILIKNYMGDYETFTMTALIPQVDLHRGNNSSLINMKQTDRKTILSKFLDLIVFSELHELAKDEIKTTQVKLKDFEKRDFSKEYADTKIKIKELDEEYKQKQKTKEQYEDLYKKINLEIQRLRGEIKKIDVKNTNIVYLENQKKIYEDSISKYKNEIIDIKNNIKDILTEKTKIDKSILELEDTDIVSLYNSLQKLLKEQNELKHNSDKYKIKIDSLKKQMGDYAGLIFSDSCDICTTNKSYVTEKLNNIEDVSEYENLFNQLNNELKNVNESIHNLDGIEDEYNKYLLYKNDLNKILKKDNTEKSILVDKQNQLHELNNKLKSLNSNISLYYENEIIIEENNKIQISIDDFKNKLSVVEDGISKITKEIMKIYSDLERNKNIESKIEDEIDNMKKLQLDSMAYRYYIESINKDGVPFELISKTIPIIEHEVNNILSQIVEFNISFIIDNDKKDIDIKIVYDEDNIWPIELVSGMERFISNIAIRVALLGVSGLPRPNFLIIDEGFGNLDSDNANNLYRLFDYLKNQFDFILIISHLDNIKDMVDNIIELKNERGYSKIIC